MNLQLTDAWLRTRTGDNAGAVHAAIAAGFSAHQRLAAPAAYAPPGDPAQTLRAGPVSDGRAADAYARMGEVAEALAAHLSATTEPVICLHCDSPGGAATRALLEAALPEPTAQRIQWLAAETLTTATLFETAASVLEQDEGVWLGALHAGLSREALAEPSPATPLAWDQREGSMPAEGAAFVRLAANGEGDHVRVAGWGDAREPVRVDADLHDFRGLATAARQALAQAGHEPEAIDAVTHPHGHTLAQHLEWHALRQDLWPQRLPDELRAAQERGEIPAPAVPETREPLCLQPSKLLGDFGAATLPLGLAVALGCLRHHRGFEGLPWRETVRRAAVLSAHEHGQRTAVLVTTD